VKNEEREEEEKKKKKEEKMVNLSHSRTQNRQEK